MTDLQILGLVFAILALFIAGINFYGSWLLPIYSWIVKKSYPNSSGLPALGTIFLVLACLCLPRGIYLGCFAALILFIDTAGLPYFFAMMIIFWLRERKKRN